LPSLLAQDYPGRAEVFLVVLAVWRSRSPRGGVGSSAGEPPREPQHGRGRRTPPRHPKAPRGDESGDGYDVGAEQHIWRSVN
ncbi:hypothetical protein AB0G40_09140, partial [Streptomyces griseorubiginosus]